MGNTPITDKNIDEIVREFNRCGRIYNSNFSLQTVIQYKNKPWNWTLVCLNDSLMSELTKDTLKSLQDKPLDWDFLSGRARKEMGYYHFVVPMSLIAEFPDKDWNYVLLTRQFFFSNNFGNLQYVRMLSHKNWDWKFLTDRVSLLFIDEFPDKDWDWKLISNRKDLTHQFIVRHLEKLTVTQNVEQILTAEEKKREFLKKYRNVDGGADVIVPSVTNSVPSAPDETEGN